MNDKAVLSNKGRMWIYDERASKKKWIEVALVDNLRIAHPINRTEIKSPSGVTVLTVSDIGSSVSGDLYHPGDLSILELMFRGAVELGEYNGTTAVNEEVEISFGAAGEAFPLPGFDGDRTVVTVNSVKSEDGATTYAVTTDYTVAVDPTTGITHIVHVAAGSIPLNEEIVVDYDYTPLESRILRPNYGGHLTERHILIDVFVDCDNQDTQYKRYYLPRGTATSELAHTLLEVGTENANANILPFSFELAKPDTCGKEAKWYWIDTVNV